MESVFAPRIGCTTTITSRIRGCGVMDTARIKARCLRALEEATGMYRLISPGTGADGDGPGSQTGRGRRTSINNVSKDTC